MNSFAVKVAGQDLSASTTDGQERLPRGYAKPGTLVCPVVEAVAVAVAVASLVSNGIIAKRFPKQQPKQKA